MIKGTKNLNTLLSEPITPIDGRYKSKTSELSPYFSEAALVKFRIKVEITYLLVLAQIGIVPKISDQSIQLINQIYTAFDLNDFEKVKEIESKIKHDVKAVEYFLREKFTELKLQKLLPYIHIGLTSEDVNNLSYGLLLKECNDEVIKTLIKNLIIQLSILSKSTNNTALLARTHGQPAVTTTFGKEIANYIYRLTKQQKRIEQFIFEGKCNGAVGNFNAMQLAYPKINWISFSKKYISSLGLQPNIFTTQILFYDNMLEYFQILEMINGILLDLSTNIWNYIMLNTLKLKWDPNAVGSSTMPQKINPIDFENAEGNLHIANSLFEMFQRKLITSRLQRDLSDSTIRRSFGTAFGHTIIAWKSLQNGLKKISVDEIGLNKELENHWEILAEAVQTYLRSIGNEQAYEKLKDLTQGKIITKEVYKEILVKLHLQNVKVLWDLTPQTYVGLAKELVNIL